MLKTDPIVGESFDNRAIADTLDEIEQFRLRRSLSRTKGMSTLIPAEYVSISEAAEIVANALSIGVEEQENVANLCELGLNVRDGRALDAAIAEIWQAADAEKLQVSAIGGAPANPCNSIRIALRKFRSSEARAAALRWFGRRINSMAT